MALIKEDAWITAGAISFYYFAEFKKWRIALVTLFFAPLVFLYHAGFLNQFNSMSERYAYLGSNVHDAISTLLHRPWIVAECYS